MTTPPQPHQWPLPDTTDRFVCLDCWNCCLCWCSGRCAQSHLKPAAPAPCLSSCTRIKDRGSINIGYEPRLTLVRVEKTSYARCFEGLWARWAEQLRRNRRERIWPQTDRNDDDAANSRALRHTRRRPAHSHSRDQRASLPSEYVNCRLHPQRLLRKPETCRRPLVPVVLLYEHTLTVVLALSCVCRCPRQVHGEQAGLWHCWYHRRCDRET